MKDTAGSSCEDIDSFVGGALEEPCWPHRRCLDRRRALWGWPTLATFEPQLPEHVAVLGNGGTGASDHRREPTNNYF